MLDDEVREPLAAFEISAKDAAERWEQGALVVDVRDSTEWATGHAPGALHVPIATLPSRLIDLMKDRDLLLMCADGARGTIAAGALRHAGFPRAMNVSGGLNAWLRAGLPTTTENGAARPPLA